MCVVRRARGGVGDELAPLPRRSDCPLPRRHVGSAPTSGELGIALFHTSLVSVDLCTLFLILPSLFAQLCSIPIASSLPTASFFH